MGVAQDRMDGVLIVVLKSIGRGEPRGYNVPAVELQQNTH